MDRVQTALVGCGKVGQTHAMALAKLPQSEFVAACDADINRAQAVAAKYGVKAYESVERMLDEAKLDAVIKFNQLSKWQLSGAEKLLQ